MDKVVGVLVQLDSELILNTVAVFLEWMNGDPMKPTTRKVFSLILETRGDQLLYHSARDSFFLIVLFPST